MRRSNMHVACPVELCLCILTVLLFSVFPGGCSSGTVSSPDGDPDQSQEADSVPSGIDVPEEATTPPSGCLPEDGWCPSGPWDQLDHFNAIRAFGPDDVWIVGWDRPVLRWDGETLSGPADLFGTTRLNGVWGTDSSNVWVCGHGGFVAHWDGSEWTEHQTGFGGTLWGIWGAGDGQIWAAGAQGTVLHFDGAAWTQTTMDENPQVAEYLSPHGIWGTSADDIWVVGNTGGASSPGFVYRWDGVNWNRVQVPPAENTSGGFGAVWGSGPDDVWVTGPDQTDIGYELDGPTPSLHWDGEDWYVVAPGFDGRFSSVHGSGPDDVWMAAEGGAAQWDGQEWTIYEVPFGTGPVAAWSPDLAWMTGKDGALYQWDGSAWSDVVWPVPDLLSVGGDGDRIWAAGTYGTVISHSGDGWSVEHPGPQVDLHSVWVDEDGQPWVAGGEGTVLRQTPDGWEDLGPGGEDTIYGIWGSSSDDVLAVGGTSVRKSSSSDPGDGFVLRWDGATWEPVGTPLAVTGFAVTGTGADDVWIVGAQRDPVHWDGAEWAAVPLPFEAMPENTVMLDIAVDPTGRVWVSGNWTPYDIEAWTGIVAWIEDGEWTVFETERTNDVAGIWSDGVQAVGAGEGVEIWTWTGDAFSLEELGKKGLNDVFGQPNGSVWVVGDEGHVYRRSL